MSCPINYRNTIFTVKTYIGNVFFLIHSYITWTFIDESYLYAFIIIID